MLKLTVSVNDVVLMEQTETGATIASFFPSPERVLDTLDRQGWYGFVNYDDKNDITTLYKVVPAYSKSILPITQ